MLLWQLNLQKGSVAYSAAGSSGTYVLTGQSASVVRAVKVSGSSGTYTLTGQSANVVLNRSASGLNGLYTLTGQSANATYTHTGSTAYSASGLSGAYYLTGQPALANYLAKGKISPSDGDEEYRPRKKRKGLGQEQSEIGASIRALFDKAESPSVSYASQQFVEAIAQINPELLSQIQDEDDIEALLLLI